MNRLGYPDTGEAIVHRPGTPQSKEVLLGTDWLIDHAALVERFKVLVWDADEGTHLVVAYLSDGRNWVSAMRDADMTLLIGTCFPAKPFERG